MRQAEPFAVVRGQSRSCQISMAESNTPIAIAAMPRTRSIMRNSVHPKGGHRAQL